MAMAVWPAPAVAAAVAGKTSVDLY